MLADSLRTDRRSFRQLQVQAPPVIELREWSRLTAELQEERNGLINRMREQLRRYYPEMLELGGDLGAGWVLELWEKASTPAEAARVRKASVAAILKRNRIRRHDAVSVLRILRQLASTIVRLKLVDQQLKQAHSRLDELLAEIVADDDSGEPEEQRDAVILRSMPGVGRIVLATLFAEASQLLAERDYRSLRILTGVAPVGEELPGEHAPCLQPAAEQRDVSLGAGGDPARSGESGAVCGAARARAAPWPGAAYGRGPVARGGVRDAA